MPEMRAIGPARIDNADDGWEERCDFKRTVNPKRIVWRTSRRPIAKAREICLLHFHF
jgi:hypothetical protein